MTLQELFEDEKHWTQNTMARDRDGNRVNLSSPDAFCYCLSGAFDKFVNEQTFIDRAGALARLRKAIETHICSSSMCVAGELFSPLATQLISSIISFNDYPDCSVEDIRAVVKAAQL